LATTQASPLAFASAITYDPAIVARRYPSARPPTRPAWTAPGRSASAYLTVSSPATTSNTATGTRSYTTAGTDVDAALSRFVVSE
jgi:hypothetical protein